MELFHFLYTEELQGSVWKFKSTELCTCHIKEDHWAERPVD